MRSSIVQATGLSPDSNSPLPWFLCVVWHLQVYEEQLRSSDGLCNQAKAHGDVDSGRDASRADADARRPANGKIDVSIRVCSGHHPDILF